MSWRLFSFKMCLLYLTKVTAHRIKAPQSFPYCGCLLNLSLREGLLWLTRLQNWFVLSVENRFVQMLSHKLACIIGRAKQACGVTQFAIWYSSHSQMHMHLYFGVEEIVNYSLNNFSGTYGMPPSETLCCSILSPITPGIWWCVSSFTRGEKIANLWLPSLLKSVTITILTDPQVEHVKNPASALFTFFKGLLFPCLKDLATSYFQWQVRVRKEGGSLVYM